MDVGFRPNYSRATPKTQLRERLVRSDAHTRTCFAVLECNVVAVRNWAATFQNRVYPLLPLRKFQEANFVIAHLNQAVEIPRADES